MKKMYLLLAATTMVLFLTTLDMYSAKPLIKQGLTPDANTTIPMELNIIFKNSCMNCHSTDGSRMAMSMVNFSKWDNYSPKKQAKKAKAICNVITKDSMPPKSFRKSHPEAIPTASQKESICKWSETLALKK